MPEQREYRHVLLASFACLALAIACFLGPVQDERAIYFLREISKHHEELSSRVEAGNVTICKELCDKEDTCAGVTYDPSQQECLLHLLGPTRRREVWTKLSSRSQAAAGFFLALSSLGFIVAAANSDCHCNGSVACCAFRIGRKFQRLHSQTSGFGQARGFAH